MSNDFDFDLCLKSPISFDIEMMRYMVTFSTCSETFIDYIAYSYRIVDIRVAMSTDDVT